MHVSIVRAYALLPPILHYYLWSRLRYHAYDVLPPLSGQSIISSALCAALPRYMAKILPTRTNMLARRGGSKFSRTADWIPLEFIKAYYEGLTGQGDPSTLSVEVVDDCRGNFDVKSLAPEIIDFGFFFLGRIKTRSGIKCRDFVAWTVRNNYFRIQSRFVTK